MTRRPPIHINSDLDDFPEKGSKTIQPQGAERSPGHIAFVGNYEYYDRDGQVFCAPIANVFDVRTGARIGRWESQRWHWDHYNRLEMIRNAFKS